MLQLSLVFQALYIALAYLAAMKYCRIALGGARAPYTDDYWEGWLHCTFKVNAQQL